MDERGMKKRPKIDESNLGCTFELEPSKGNKSKHKERKKKHGTDKMFISNELLEENCTAEAARKQTCSTEEDGTFKRDGEEESNTKRRKKRKDSEIVNGNIADDKEMQSMDDNQRSRKKKRKICHDLSDGMQDMADTKLRKKGKTTEDIELKSNVVNPPYAKSDEGEVDDQGKKMKRNKKKKLSKKSKRVTFADKVEVCCDRLVRGKRFTPEEDEKIKEAVYDYIESHGLGEEGLDMVLHCKSHRKVRDCWKEIAAVLPERPITSVYHRAHILFERDEESKWTPEEFEFVRKAKEQHGADWKMIAEAMGKHRQHVKEAWRRIKLTNTNKGRWSQQEYQNLFDLVNLDLRLRASQEYRKLKHGMLRDNISWEAIANKLATRTSQRCCMKWYHQLTSPMVVEGMWSDTDDYHLVSALFTLDAYCMEEVDWDNLLEHRSGDVCRKRWSQMVQHIGEHGRKSFAEQVEILSKRFCPDLLETREAFDSKPVVC